jgi:hypothetical protein
VANRHFDPYHSVPFHHGTANIDLGPYKDYQGTPDTASSLNTGQGLLLHNYPGIFDPFSVF